MQITFDSNDLSPLDRQLLRSIVAGFPDVVQVSPPAEQSVVPQSSPQPAASPAAGDPWTQPTAQAQPEPAAEQKAPAKPRAKRRTAKQIAEDAAREAAAAKATENESDEDEGDDEPPVTAAPVMDFSQFVQPQQGNASMGGQPVPQAQPQFVQPTAPPAPQPQVPVDPSTLPNFAGYSPVDGTPMFFQPQPQPGVGQPF